METNNIDLIGIFRRIWPLRLAIILLDLLMIVSISIPLFLVPTLLLVVFIGVASIFVTIMPINGLIVYLYYVKLIRDFEIDNGTLSLKSSLTRKKISLENIEKIIVSFQEEEKEGGWIVIEGSDGEIWSCRASHFKNLDDFIRFKDRLASLPEKHKFKIENIKNVRKK